MPIYKYIKEFLIPPGIYVTIFAFVSLYLWLIHTLVKKINQKSISCLNTVRVMLLAGTSFCVICCIATYAMSINAGSQRIMHSLEYKYTNKSTVNSFAQIFSFSIDMAAQVPLPASARHLNSNHSARTTFAY